MNKRAKTAKLLRSRSEVIKLAYQQILKGAITLLSSIEVNDLRQTLVRENNPEDELGETLNELISPLIYLSLRCSLLGDYHINYGWEEGNLAQHYFAITSAFIRLVYKETMSNVTSMNIEDVVSTDWVVTNSADLFEHVSDRNRYHTLKVLPYQPLHAPENLVTVV